MSEPDNANGDLGGQGVEFIAIWLGLTMFGLMAGLAITFALVAIGAIR